MVKERRILLEKYLEEQNLISSQIESFNNFCDIVLPRIMEENNIIRPIIPLPTVDEVKIELRKIWVEKPIIYDIYDGNNKKFYPIEARLRKLTYRSSVKVEAVFHLDDTIKEIDVIEIAKLPIMLKSKYCNLYGLNDEELIRLGEDPEDYGGYFIINGNERVLIMQEDLAGNRFFVSSKGENIIGRYISGKSVFRNPVTVEIKKDGSIIVSSGVLENIPFPLLLKALGMKSDQEIFSFIKVEDELVFLNLYEWAHITTEEEAKLEIAKLSGQMQPTKEMRLKRINDILNNYFMSDIKDNYLKAVNIAKFVKKIILYKKGLYDEEDKDHYANKRVKLAGDLLEDLFRVGFKLLVRDTIYNTQKHSKRGKIPQLKILIREKVINQRLETAFNTGQWLNMTGISQTLQKTNIFDVISHTMRVVSNLDKSLKHIEARRLHGTHWGRFDLIETPEGQTIGLRKQLTLFSKVSQEIKNKEDIFKKLEELGVKKVENVDFKID